MNILLFLTAVAAGYLAGSVSFARILGRLAARDGVIPPIEYRVPGSDEIFRSESISSTAVRMHLGAGYGCLTAILDIAKVALTAGAFRLFAPEFPYYVPAACAGLLGHNFPLYHRFSGGRGESAIIGGLLVIDPLGLMVTSAASWLLGIAAGHLLILRWAWLPLLPVWFALQNAGPWYVGYALFINAVYWPLIAPDLIAYARLGKRGVNPTQEQIAEFYAMGRPLGRFLDRWSLLALLSRADRHKTGKRRAAGDRE